ncbi:short-chain fatty acid transporter [Roseospira marina]|uniref:Short-chain fatty acid transporter n=1 Tax=Roseospira marina TaxID=140057 RepID=A0A5M6IC37_9PROT|nr:TIGR00366 family protein [Roseospira marina]KAA5605305.1 short-chain fatty acid transporter [Roseospira marina]MBB4314773.1 short-chain fatty acids transporter [Roseospira marina]MBB5087762.1 short-chain fatty acids transporter [Roseospira marina]
MSKHVAAATAGTASLDADDETPSQGGLARLAYAFTQWAEKWFPDAFIFVILTTLVVTVADLAIGAGPLEIAEGFGSGFWSLIPFTMQMAMVAITGYVVASSPPCTRLIAKLASVPGTGPQAVAWVAFVSMASSYLNWALSLVLGGLLVRALARRGELHMDYRAASAAAYLGLGSTWALGLSSSSAMLQANALSLPKSISEISGVIPLSETIFLWQSVVLYFVLMIMSILVFYFASPRGHHVKTAEDMGVDVRSEMATEQAPSRPGDWFEFTPVLPILIVLLAVGYFWGQFSEKGLLATVSSLNNYNFFFLMLGLLLHRNIRSFLVAVTKAVPTAAGVIIQFPFYGAIAAMLTHVVGSDGASISHHLSHLFVSIANGDTFPVIIGIYSSVLGFLVPSGGGKWIIEAPYVLQAAKDMHAHMGWAVQIYNAAEALPNLINPFWMLPLLGIVKLQARDIVGFTFTQLLISAPVVMFLLWLFAETLAT